jgi:hypothetical protein
MSDSEFAKTHLREHLGSLLVEPISEGFWSIYKTAKDLCDRNGQQSEILRTFQNMLTRIPEWSDSTLSTEVERIQKITKCTYLDDLIMGVFIAYMKSFASLHYKGGSSEIKVEFDRPSLAKFVHELYKHSARKVWQVAYLFKTVGVTTEQQARNRQDIDKLVGECMEQVIRSFLPWEAIAKKYFAEPQVEDIIKPVEPVAEETQKAVTFGEADADSESESEDEEEEKPKLTLGDEDAAIDFVNLDEPPPAEVEIPETPKEKDPMEEISSKAEETLVLNL